MLKSGIIDVHKPILLVKEMLRELKYQWYHGDCIFQYDWDICIILDACRYDLLMSVKDEFDWIRNVEKKHSIASESQKWMKRTFLFEDLSNIDYICGNPLSEKVGIKECGFNHVYEIWQDYWNDEYGTIMPKYITNQIKGKMISSDKRILAHYMQPHYPFVKGSLIGPKMSAGPTKHDEIYNIWDLLEKGEYTYKEVWEGYKHNLRVVLEYVGIIVKHTDRQILITSDHGNGLGENGIYGHPKNCKSKEVREIPHIMINSVDDKLRDLGYK